MKYSIASCMIACLFVIGAAIAGDEVAAPKVLNAEDAFDHMKALNGTWKGEAVTVPVGEDKASGVTSETTVTYETIANDTSVVATYAEDTEMEMLSLYHMDGPEALVHTHYCAAGNQPSMRFVPSKNPNEIVFKFSNGSNMDVNKDTHVHDAAIRFIDADTIETETAIWGGGKHSHTRYSTMKRAK